MEAEILHALNDYRDCVTKQNLNSVKQLVEYAANEEYNPQYLDGYTGQEREDMIEESEEEIAATRLDWLIRKLGDAGSELITQPEDVLKHWDVYCKLSGLNGAAYDDRDLENRAKMEEDYVRGLQDGLKALGGEAATLELPADFLILLHHVDTLEGHLWREEKEQGRQLVFFEGFLGYEQAKEEVRPGEALKGYPAYAWGEDYEYPDFQDVVAGWRCGDAPEGSCHVIYGREKADEQPGWHYHLNKGQFGSDVFKNIVDLLKWYQDYNLPSDSQLSDSCEGLWDP